MNNQYSNLPEETTHYILRKYNLEHDYFIREKKCYEMTGGTARSTRHHLEKEGKFPARKMLGKNSCAWSLVEVLNWMENTPDVGTPHQPTKRRGFANGSY